MSDFSFNCIIMRSLLYVDRLELIVIHKIWSESTYKFSKWERTSFVIIDRTNVMLLGLLIAIVGTIKIKHSLMNAITLLNYMSLTSKMWSKQGHILVWSLEASLVSEGYLGVDIMARNLYHNLYFKINVITYLLKSFNFLRFMGKIYAIWPLGTDVNNRWSFVYKCLWWFYFSNYLVAACFTLYTCGHASDDITIATFSFLEFVSMMEGIIILINYKYYHVTLQVWTSISTKFYC